MVQFLDRDALTAEQAARNAAAQATMIRGKYYRFDPPVKATGFPTGGHTAGDLKELEFDRGWYLGFDNGNHVFQGKPINDPRVIFAPKGYEDAPNVDAVLESRRECYFHVLFVGGSSASLDSNQVY